MGRARVNSVVAGLAILLAGCTPGAPPSAVERERPEVREEATRVERPARPITLAFAGDIHFQLHLAALLDKPDATLGPSGRALATADVAMVNLESAITDRGVPDPKALEDSWDRYWFRAPASALDVLARSGVDVVGVANNHGADYGPIGVRDTLRAERRAPLSVVGIGRDRRQAFTPHRTTVKGVTLAFFAADASPLESTESVWRAGPRSPGLADAHEPRPSALLAAVRKAARAVDIVVVYLHWGQELQACPTRDQRTTARALARAGADVVVGSHAHVLLGSGWMRGAYVSYGLGNFVWYHNHQPETGVLRLRVEEGEVVSDEWVPAEIGIWGRPVPLSGARRKAAVADWQALRGCAGLHDRPTVGPIPSAAR
ncbi:CapA family protein [Nocardioides sp.]|uniref:CapA family protein n=1 Tax=Nocardioides sp. TaxID=35761 RepID=UPI002ED6936C